MIKEKLSKIYVYINVNKSGKLYLRYEILNLNYFVIFKSNFYYNETSQMFVSAYKVIDLQFDYRTKEIVFFGERYQSSKNENKNRYEYVITNTEEQERILQDVYDDLNSKNETNKTKTK